MCVKPVLCLIENNAQRSVDYILGYLITPVSGQAVEDDGIFVGNAHELGVDLIVLEDLDSLGLLGFLTH